MTTPSAKLSCSVSVDVDSFDSLWRFYCGKRANLCGPDPVYRYAVPRFLKLFDECNLKATFFVVANDFVGSNQNREILRDIISRGHEVANHSLNHEFAFSSLSRHDKSGYYKFYGYYKDACGVLPRGFRIPG